MERKSTVLLLTTVFAALSAQAFGQRFDSIRPIMEKERVSPQEAAAVLAISQGTGMSPGVVVRVKDKARAKLWDMGPAFYIGQITGSDPAYIWREHERGASWDQLEGYGRRYDDNRRPKKPKNRGGLYDDYNGSYGRYGKSVDEAYSQMVWDRFLNRAFGADVDRMWRFTHRGFSEADLALAAYLGQLARVDPYQVMIQYDRMRNWNRVRDDIGVSSDWDSLRRYGRGR
jgi:hypothetical protein